GTSLNTIARSHHLPSDHYQTVYTASGFALRPAKAGLHNDFDTILSLSARAKNNFMLKSKLIVLALILALCCLLPAWQISAQDGSSVTEHGQARTAS
ncbi:MAG: hypothetical protein OXI62_01195, partial [Chloroflexota bacterium]|nr:hypothetical protein [Chloroflexota bacterium]